MVTKSTCERSDIDSSPWFGDLGGDNGVQHFYPVIAGLVLSVPMSSFLRGFLRNATFADAGGLALGTS
jgi:hypothetical protein